METYIKKYLSQHYYIQTSDVGNDGIYYLFDDRRIPTPFFGNKLIKEISVVFGLEVEESKDYIIGWSISVKSDVDLEFYWKQIHELFGLPITHQIVARTVGMDLVPVQPMNLPTGMLMYMDYVYSGDTPKTNGRVYNSEVLQRETEEIERESWFGELDHPKADAIQTLFDNQRSKINKRIKIYR